MTGDERRGWAAIIAVLAVVAATIVFGGQHAGTATAGDHCAAEWATVRHQPAWQNRFRSDWMTACHDTDRVVQQIGNR